MTNSNKQPIQDLTEKLYSKLDKINNILDVDEVLIENQPSLKNPTMKTIASVLYSYFILRGVIDKNNDKIKLVRFVSPSNKLKVDKIHTNSVLNKEKEKNK